MNAPRRVLLITPSLGRGGAERHAVTMATTLDRERWRPHVLSLSGGPLVDELEAAGVEVTVADTGRGLRSLAAATAAVRREVARVDPDMLSVHDVLVELAARAEVRARPRPLLVWKHTYGNTGRRDLRERAIEQLSSGLVTRYGAVCHTQVRYLTDDLGLDPTKIRVVTNSVVEQPPVAWPPGPPVVAAVAAMRADKGHRSLLRAWVQVVREVPDARLMLIGDGPLRPELESMVGDLGLAGRVTFVGETPSPQRELAHAHVLTIASYAVECFPYAALEALAIGRPVVSTTVGGMPELVHDGLTGLLIPPGDDGAMARALTTVCSDLDHARDLGDAGRTALRRGLPFPRWVSAVHALLDDTADVRTVR